MKKKSAVFTIFLLLLFAGTGICWADTYPSKPITLIIPFGAGGSHDLNGRVFTSIIPQYLGQPMVVKLMPGAGGQTGTYAAVRAKPDGYTLIFTHNFVDQLQPLTEDLPYDTTKALTSVWQLNSSAPIVWVKADKPWKTLDEMLDYGKKNPGKLVFPNSGKWGAGFTPGAMMLTQAGVDARYIPYKGGGPVLKAVLAGDGDFTFARASTIMGLYKSGKVRILAVGGDKRLGELPEVPSFKELGFGSGGIMHRVILAPRDTPPERLKILRDAFGKLYQDKTFIKLMKQISEDVDYIDGPDYEKLRPIQKESYTNLVNKLTGQ